MTTTLRVRFDGKVIVPIGPADLPTDREFEMQVSDASLAEGSDRPLLRLGQALDQLAAEFPPDPNAPTDGAAQHDHYLYGTPKRVNP